MQIARYFASLSVDISQSSFKKADKALDGIENRLNKLGKLGNKPISFTIGNFDIDQKKLSVALGNALDVASRQVTFEISRFSVNNSALRQALSQSSHGLGGITRSSGGIGSSVLTSAEFDRRQQALGSAALLRHQRSLELANLRRSGIGGSGIRAGIGVGGFGASSVVGPALALGLGGYGLSALNQRNQEVVSAQLQSSAVVQQAGGTAQQGTASFEYLRSEGNRIGFNYLEASGDYNKLISGLTGSGVGLKESQKVFSGFAELARVNKLDKTTQNRLFRALSQVAGKGKLQAEELTGQIAEALPGGTALFARAYQAQLKARGQGGDLTGQAAIAKLQADMKKGLVSSDILTYAGATASRDAQGGLPAAQTASQAEQQRYQNSLTDLAVVASNAGVEEGFARIFRTLASGLDESNSLVISLAEGFNEATKYADDLLLFPQSFIRALEGKDSLVADWLGMDSTGQLVSDWKEIKNLWSDISAIKPSDLFGNFLPTIEATAREIAGIIDAVAAFKQINDNASASADIVQADIASRGDGPFSNFISSLAGSIAGASAYISTPLNVQDSNQYKDYVANEYPRGAQAVADKEQLQAITQTFQFQVGLNIDPVSMAQLDVAAQADALANEFRGLVTGLFEQASVNFPTKE